MRSASRPNAPLEHATHAAPVEPKCQQVGTRRARKMPDKFYMTLWMPRCEGKGQQKIEAAESESAFCQATLAWKDHGRRAGRKSDRFHLSLGNVFSKTQNGLLMVSSSMLLSALAVTRAKAHSDARSRGRTSMAIGTETASAQRSRRCRSNAVLPVLCLGHARHLCLACLPH